MNGFVGTFVVLLIIGGVGGQYGNNDEIEVGLEVLKFQIRSGAPELALKQIEYLFCIGADAGQIDGAIIDVFSPFGTIPCGDPHPPCLPWLRPKHPPSNNNNDDDSDDNAASFDDVGKFLGSVYAQYPETIGQTAVPLFVQTIIDANLSEKIILDGLTSAFTSANAFLKGPDFVTAVAKTNCSIFKKVTATFPQKDLEKVTDLAKAISAAQTIC